jgi:hypothetical protein
VRRKRGGGGISCVIIHERDGSMEEYESSDDVIVYDLPLQKKSQRPFPLLY